MPDLVKDLSRPTPVPRLLGGPSGVLEGLQIVPATERDAAAVRELRVTGITHDSGRVRPGDLFAALPGTNTHGGRHVPQALDRGAVAILTDPAGQQHSRAPGVPVVVHDDPRTVLGELAARVYGHPGDALLLVGVTGTNGKTTTTHLLEAAFRAAGRRTGLIGTVGSHIGEARLPSVRTTPEATDVHALLAVMRDEGVEAVFLEVSSHALVLGRVDGLVFDVAVFTGLSQDHLDFHHDMEEYFIAKAGLFAPDRARRAVVCVDDGWGARLADTASLPRITYAVDHPADWSAREVRQTPGGSCATVSGPGGRELGLTVALPGRFNVANAIGALAAATEAGLDPHDAVSGIARCAGVPGRMERIADPDDRRALVALVDYAHTPDAVARALTAASEGAAGRVIAVVGAGGDRDPDKRRAMGRTAAQLADVVVVTDDNPRSEDPVTIRAALLSGAREVPDAVVHEVGDRAGAIATAVHVAAPGDLVLVLGKGHEQGQEVAGRVHPFDDRVALGEALAGVR